jgi:arylsulfatase A-like enzyme
MASNLNRRTFLKWSAAGAVAAAMPESGRDVQMLGRFTATPAKKLNILMIFIDELNTWIEPLAGHPQARTPNLMRLAQMGIVFENAYSPAPQCNPGRTAIMTGLRPSSSGIYENNVCFRDKPDLKERLTLPQFLQKNGYKTLTGGKVFHLPQGKFADPQSWDVMFQQRCGTPAPAKDKQYAHRLNGKFSSSYYNSAIDWAPLEVDASKTEDWKTAQLAGKLLQEKHNKPFFLTCGFFRPHLPWYVPSAYFDMHPADKIVTPSYRRDDLDDIPMAGRRLAGGSDFRLIRDNGLWNNAIQGYMASVSFADACVGQVLDALEAGPYKNDTIIVLCGDHGFHLGEKDHLEKNTLWEAATHTPLMVVAPGLTSEGSRCSQPVSLLDIHATLMELAETPSRKDIDGRSLVPLLDNPDKEWNYPVLMTARYNNHAVRDSRYRYIRYSDGSEELYDHAADPNEWTNLVPREQYRPIKDQLALWLPSRNEPEFVPPQPKKETPK